MLILIQGLLTPAGFPILALETIDNTSTHSNFPVRAPQYS